MQASSEHLYLYRIACKADLLSRTLHSHDTSKIAFNLEDAMHSGIQILVLQLGNPFCQMTSGTTSDITVRTANKIVHFHVLAVGTVPKRHHFKSLTYVCFAFIDTMVSSNDPIGTVHIICYVSFEKAFGWVDGDGSDFTRKTSLLPKIPIACQNITEL